MTESTETKKKGGKKLTRTGQGSLADWLGSFGSEDIGVDIGTSNIVVFIKHKGLVFPEATVIARNEVLHEYMAYGTKAEEMEGKTPPEIKIIHPMKRSAIVDYTGTAYL